MSRSLLVALFLAAAVFPAHRFARAADAEFDAAMKPILVEYLKISDVLASDKTEGVAAAATSIAKLCDALAKTKPVGEKAAELAKAAATLKESAEAVAKAKDIKAMRVALDALSKPLVMWVSIVKPAEIHAFYCPMRKAAWVQRGESMRNPYYGASMLECGQWVGGARPDPASSPRK